MDTGNNSFDSTPRLKSSPVPVLFIPFKNDEKKCNYCGIEYSNTIKFKQKYCKNCLFWYIKYTIGNNTCLDTCIVTNNVQCIVYEANRNNFSTMNIQEWCEYCSEVLYFRQITPNTLSFCKNLFSICTHNKIDCKLCDKRWTSFFSDHGQYSYKISFGWVESTLIKKPISILNLPLWNNYDECVICQLELKYLSEPEYYCQKWCSNCYIIYIRCRYCLTTNIIFGITDQSECKKCKRISFIAIDITDISSGNCVIDEFLFSTINNYNHLLIDNYINTNDASSNPLKVYNFIRLLYYKSHKIKWIPYPQIKNLRKIGERGFSTIYKATWSNGVYDRDVAVKKLFNSHCANKYFINEVKFNI
jgi:hypothetical protein